MGPQRKKVIRKEELGETPLSVREDRQDRRKKKSLVFIEPERGEPFRGDALLLPGAEEAIKESPKGAKTARKKRKSKWTW